MPTFLPKRPKARFTAAATILGALALAVPTLAAGPAGAGPGPACGSTVTTNLTLTADLSCPSGDGLIVGATGITIDLGGHTITGSAGGIGVTNPGFATVTIRNGAITGFGTAVQVTSAPGNLVETLHVTISETATGILLNAADQAQVQNNVLSGGATAILLRADSNDPSNRAEENVVFKNTISGSQEAIAIVGSNDNHLINNTVTGGATAFRIAGGSGGNDLTNNHASGGSSTGLLVDASNNSSNDVGGNQFTDFEGAGILIEAGPSTTQLLGNKTIRNDVGISAGAAGSSLGGNTANDNRVRGMTAGEGVEDLGSNMASGNPDPQCINVVCTPSPLAAHPDATVRKPGGQIQGRSVLHPAGEGQTKHVRALPNGPGQLVVRVHNDHDVAAVFAVSAPESGSQGFRTRFHSHGTDVTRAVRAGTFVASVEPEGVMVLHLTVKARAGTEPGATGSYFVTVSNLHDGERLDAIKVHERAV
jgi:parallel beta-helix repeat protein